MLNRNFSLYNRFLLYFIYFSFGWLLFFNVNLKEGKSTLGKLIALVVLVSLPVLKIRFLENIKRPYFKESLIVSGIAFSYLLINHVFRNESFTWAQIILMFSIYAIAVPWSKLNIVFIKWLVIFSSAFFGAWAVAQVLFFNINRAGFYAVNPIPYAVVAACMFITCMAIFLNEKNKLLKISSLISALGPLTATILSDTRGVWIALVATIFIFMVARLFSKLSIKTAITSMVVLLILFAPAFVYKDSIVKRYNQTKMEFQKIEGDNLNSSIGIRLQLWERGIFYIKERPLFGMGTEGYKARIQEDYSNGLITQPALRISYSHFHNFFLDTMVRYGTIGLIVLLTWMAFPIYTHHRLRNIRIRNWLSIMLLTVSISGLTDTPFHLSYFIYFYVFVFYGSIFLNFYSPKKVDKNNIFAN